MLLCKARVQSSQTTTDNTHGTPEVNAEANKTCPEWVVQEIRDFAEERYNGVKGVALHTTRTIGHLLPTLDTSYLSGHIIKSLLQAIRHAHHDITTVTLTASYPSRDTELFLTPTVLYSVTNSNDSYWGESYFSCSGNITTLDQTDNYIDCISNNVLLNGSRMTTDSVDYVSIVQQTMEESIPTNNRVSSPLVSPASLVETSQTETAFEEIPQTNPDVSEISQTNTASEEIPQPITDFMETSQTKTAFEEIPQPITNFIETSQTNTDVEEIPQTNADVVETPQTNTGFANPTPQPSTPFVNITSGTWASVNTDYVEHSTKNILTTVSEDITVVNGYVSNATYLYDTTTSSNESKANRADSFKTGNTIGWRFPGSWTVQCAEEDIYSVEYVVLTIPIQYDVPPSSANTTPPDLR